MNAVGRRVVLEDYGQQVYAVPAVGADLSELLGQAYQLPPGGPYRWRTVVTGEHGDGRMHETKAKAKQHLRHRTQALLDQRGTGGSDA